MNRFIRMLMTLVLLTIYASWPAQARPALWFDDNGNPIPFPTQTSEPYSPLTQRPTNAPAGAHVVPGAAQESPPRSAISGAPVNDRDVSGILILLIVIGIGSWIGSSRIIARQVQEHSRLHHQAQQLERTFWAAGSIEQASDSLEVGSTFHFIAQSALAAKEEHAQFFGDSHRHRWVGKSIQSAVDEIEIRLQRGLVSLAGLGTATPIAGMFAITWSITQAPGTTAEPLITAVIGLAFALPIALGYCLLLRRHRSALRELRAFGQDLQAVLSSAEATENLDWVPVCPKPVNRCPTSG